MPVSVYINFIIGLCLQVCLIRNHGYIILGFRLYSRFTRFRLQIRNIMCQVEGTSNQVFVDMILGVWLQEHNCGYRIYAMVWKIKEKIKLASPVKITKIMQDLFLQPVLA